MKDKIDRFVLAPVMVVFYAILILILLPFEIINDRLNR